MASWLSFFFGIPDVRKDTPRNRPPPRVLPIRDNGLNPKLPDTPNLTPLKNWSHPFKDSRDPLQQLTHMAKAAAGYYPLGRNGMFHGGVHFDGGTVDVPFSRNFVLVRHHLQAPKITGSPDVPPSLTFYSLYLHLQDWAVYQDNPAQARPPFWPQSPIRRVKQTANDGRPGHPEETGLNVRNADYQGKVIELLPRGTEVVVSGKGYYRKLENRLGPSALLDADGALRGYIAASLLRPEADGEYRIVSSRERVNVRAEPDISSEVLLELPTGSVLRVSGEGDFRKLERVNQYLYFAELESEPAPQAVDQIVVLEQPVPIKAGALIGHIGDYQDGYVERPEQRLHLEVFSGDDIDLYFEASRAWAQRLPAKEKTWLKLAKGTAVVPHRDDVTGPLLRTWSETSPLSDADLLIPRSLLDSLPAEKKFHVPGRDGRNDRRWYRLDGLLHDAEQNLLNGWVCEEVGVTPTVSPWAWEGYDVLFDYSTPRHNTASFFSVIGEFTEAQCQRFKPLADNDNAGPMKQRLYDIIDRNRDGHITGDELQTALQLPAHAQAISQMVLRKESEWFYTREKWDGVDELMGHCGSTPELNWVAEKQRIEQLGWWSEVAERVGLPSWGRPYHFHPIGLVGAFFKRSCACERDITLDELRVVLSQEQISSGLFQKSNHSSIKFMDPRKFLAVLNQAMNRYGITECLDKAFFLSNVAVECDRFKTTEEYKNKNGSIPEHWQSYRGGADYHGRGLIQLTHIENYKSYFQEERMPLTTNLDEIASSALLATRSAGWFWRKGSAWGDLSTHSKSNDLIKVIIGVNGGFNHAWEREAYALALIDELKISTCSTHGGKDFGKYKFSKSSLSSSSTAQNIWKRYFGDSDEIYKK